MPIEVVIVRSKRIEVEVRVYRPAWKKFLYY